MEIDNLRQRLSDLRSVLFDPLSENRDFRCDICNKYLSIPPILFHASVGKVCGRCFEKGETKKYVDISFEIQTVYSGIAKHIIYPCSFQAKGCKEMLEWGRVSEHENCCRYRDNKCPFGVDGIISEGMKCEWSGDNRNLFLHLSEKHGGYFSSCLKMTVTDYNPNGSILISHFMEIPIVAILFVTDDLKRIVFHLLMDTVILQCEAHSYDLEVSDESGKHKIVFPENRVAPLCERAFTRKCLEHGFDLDLEGLGPLLRSNCFNFWFKIKSKQSHSLKENPDLSRNKYHIFSQECFACKTILLDQIYICSHGHNICNVCHNTKNECGCRMKITDDRNVILENLSQLSLYSCKNKDQGCSELVSSSCLRYHEEYCKLTAKECVMDCEWSGNNVEMLQHVEEKHSKIDLNAEYLYDHSISGTEKFFTIWDGRIFVFSIHSDESRKLLIVKVKYLYTGEPGQYRFEFVIMSGKLKLKCCHYCQPILCDRTEGEPEGIIFPYVFLKQFLLEKNQFHFRVNIFS